MAAFCKDTLLKIIDESECHEDIAPLISLLPFNQVKSTLYNYVKHQLTENDKIRREYYNRVNIEELIPEDLLTSILSYLSFKETSKTSRISQTLHTISESLLSRHQIALTINDQSDYFNTKKAKQDTIEFVDDAKLPTFEIEFIKFEKFLSNQTIKDFMHRYWTRITHLNINNTSTDLNMLLNKFGLKLTKNVKSLLYNYPITHSDNIINDDDKDEDSSEDDGLIIHNFGFIQSGRNLEFVSINFQGDKTWNVLIRNCPNLHGLYLQITELQDIDTKTIKLEPAPNVWSLTIDSEESYDMLVTGFNVKWLNMLMEACRNLYHLSVDLNIEITETDYFRLPTKNLLSLSFGTEVLFHSNCKFIQDCKNLRFLDLPFDVQLEDVNNSADGLYKILAKVVNGNQMDNEVFIAITDTSEGFEESVNDLLLGMDDDDDDEDEGLDEIFGRLKELLVQRYECTNDALRRCFMLVEHELGEDEMKFAKRMGRVTFGLSEGRIKEIKQEDLLGFVAERVLGDGNEFRVFIKQLCDSPVVDDLTEDDMYL